jgi:hypothetical protein
LPGGNIVEEGTRVFDADGTGHRDGRTGDRFLQIERVEDVRKKRPRKPGALSGCLQRHNVHCAEPFRTLVNLKTD